jgi:hypothetical protein
MQTDIPLARHQTNQCQADRCEQLPSLFTLVTLADFDADARKRSKRCLQHSPSSCFGNHIDQCVYFACPPTQDRSSILVWNLLFLMNDFRIRPELHRGAQFLAITS